MLFRVKVPEGQVELSLRLSHTDPAAAKRERRKADRERERGKERGVEVSSNGESSDSDRLLMSVPSKLKIQI